MTEFRLFVFLAVFFLFKIAIFKSPLSLTTMFKSKEEVISNKTDTLQLFSTTKEYDFMKISIRRNFKGRIKCKS